MSTFYTDEELNRFLAEMPRHTDDSEVVYGDVNPVIAAHLVKKRFIKAAMFPEAPACANLRQDFLMALNRENWKALNPHATIEYCCSIHSSEIKVTDIPWSLRQSDPEIRDFIIAQINCPTGDPASHEMAVILHAYRYRQRALLFISPPETRKTGFEPTFHADWKMHATHKAIAGAQMEWLCGPMSDEEIRSTKDKDSFCKQFDPTRVRKVPLGWVTISNDRFVHRSPPDIYDHGQLAYNIISFDS
jgi:hypothetical protein